MNFSGCIRFFGITTQAFLSHVEEARNARQVKKFKTRNARGVGPQPVMNSRVVVVQDLVKTFRYFFRNLMAES